MNRELDKYEWGDGVFTLLSWFKKDRVKNARVLVAGCGALGNEVVKNLALFGVGHIYVVDFDRIEISNLTRSVLFRESDAKEHAYKAEVVARRAMEINPQIRVIPIVGNLASEVGFGIYRSVDVIIGCLDSRLARYLLNRMAMRAGKPWIDGGIENLTGNVRVFTPGVNCYECSLSREEFNNIMLRTGCADVVRMQEQAGRVATTPISASIIGAMQVQEAMKIINTAGNADTTDSAETGGTETAKGMKQAFHTLEGRLLRYEGMTNTMNIYRYASWKNTCPAHERWDNILKCGELSAKMSLNEVLATLRRLFGVKNVEIVMRNNKFVDKVITDHPEKEYAVAIPESRLEYYIRNNEELRKKSYRTVLHKKVIESLSSTFPYPDLTLEQIGIPPFDVIQVVTTRKQYFVELTGDAELYH